MLLLKNWRFQIKKRGTCYVLEDKKNAKKLQIRCLQIQSEETKYDRSNPILKSHDYATSESQLSYQGTSKLPPAF